MRLENWSDVLLERQWNGGYDWRGLLGAFVRQPRGFTRAASDARRALGRLGAAAEGWSP